MRIRYLACAVIIGYYLSFAGISHAEDKKPEKISNIKNVLAPIILSSQAKALGNNFNVKGKERTVFEGVLIESSGKEKNAKVTIDKYQRIKLEGFSGEGSITEYDNQQRNSSSPISEKEYLETFLFDTVEGMLASLEKGKATVRLLGQKFGPHPKINPEYNGPKYDIYDVTLDNSFKDIITSNTKQYHFDSKSHLLYKTVYWDNTFSNPVKVETYFSVWSTIDDLSHPSQIDRYVNGKRIYTFIATNILSGPTVD